MPVKGPMPELGRRKGGGGGLFAPSPYILGSQNTPVISESKL